MRTTHLVPDLGPDLLPALLGHSLGHTGGRWRPPSPRTLPDNSIFPRVIELGGGGGGAWWRGCGVRRKIDQSRYRLTGRSTARCLPVHKVAAICFRPPVSALKPPFTMDIKKAQSARHPHRRIAQMLQIFFNPPHINHCGAEKTKRLAKIGGFRNHCNVQSALFAAWAFPLLKLKFIS